MNQNRKTIIVTSGPTNEFIDSVMKITNMSTGALGAIITDRIIERCNENIEKIYYISTKMAYKPRSTSDKIEPVTIETTQQLLNALTELLTTKRIDLVIHNAAVGDYGAKYTARAEDIIAEICERQTKAGQPMSADEMMSIFENPACTLNDGTKMSSYEPHMMTMMKLTPKVIGHIKQLSPDTMLIGSKLLDGVSKDELYTVAHNLLKKNRADAILANDLSKINKNGHWAMLLNENGIIMECHTKQEIADGIIAVAHLA